jgi:hypothetical protein
MNDKVSILTAIVLVAMLTEAIVSAGDIGTFESAQAGTLAGVTIDRKAPPAITGDNVYVAWWTNNTANNNEEIMFRVSTDGGATFGDKINLSNTTNADSWRVEIAGEGDNVVVSWWETNETSDTPVARTSTDAGETFGPMLMLATNGTIGESEGTEE